LELGVLRCALLQKAFAIFNDKNVMIAFIFKFFFKFRFKILKFIILGLKPVSHQDLFDSLEKVFSI
jgi:hypothetical protein